MSGLSGLLYESLCIDSSVMYFFVLISLFLPLYIYIHAMNMYIYIYRLVEARKNKNTNDIHVISKVYQILDLKLQKSSAPAKNTPENGANGFRSRKEASQEVGLFPRENPFNFSIVSIEPKSRTLIYYYFPYISIW